MAEAWIDRAHALAVIKVFGPWLRSDSTVRGSAETEALRVHVAEALRFIADSPATARDAQGRWSRA